LIIGDKIHYDADRLMSVGDPTGTGDVFWASYIIGRFLKQKNISEACTDAAKLVAQQIAGNYIKKTPLCWLTKTGPIKIKSDHVNFNRSLYSQGGLC
jgi:pyridoxal/pyridoxine/pyridoxamine kinase